MRRGVSQLRPRSRLHSDTAIKMVWRGAPRWDVWLALAAVALGVYAMRRVVPENRCSMSYMSPAYAEAAPAVP